MNASLWAGGQGGVSGSPVCQGQVLHGRPVSAVPASIEYLVVAAMKAVAPRHVKLAGGASRDGGVDAIAFDPDPIRGGKIIIQAKRYTNIVGVSAVRDLYGTVINEGANKGILITTAYYGADAYDFAKDKPITLLNGGHLLFMLQKHGQRAKIDLKEAKKIIAEKENTE